MTTEVSDLFLTTQGSNTLLPIHLPSWFVLSVALRSPQCRKDMHLFSSEYVSFIFHFYVFQPMNVGTEKTMICEARKEVENIDMEVEQLGGEESETRRDGEKGRRLASNAVKFKEQIHGNYQNDWLWPERIQRGNQGKKA